MAPSFPTKIALVSTLMGMATIQGVKGKEAKTEKGKGWC